MVDLVKLDRNFIAGLAVVIFLIIGVAGYRIANQTEQVTQIEVMQDEDFCMSRLMEVSVVERVELLSRENVPNQEAALGIFETMLVSEVEELEELLADLRVGLKPSVNTQNWQPTLMMAQAVDDQQAALCPQKDAED